MKTVYAKIYSKQRGFTKFPIDMLRYDSCYPAKETDSNFLANVIDHSHRLIPQKEDHWVVVVAKKVPERAKAPHFTSGRWDSFGCVVEETDNSAEQSKFLPAHSH